MAESAANAGDTSPEKSSQDCPAEIKVSSEDNVELDDLLDSALEDFDKAAPTQLSAPVTQESSETPLQTTINESTDIPPSQEALFNELFNSGAGGEAAADFQNALGDLMSELNKEFTQDPQFNEELSKLLQTTIPPGAMPPASSASSTPSTAQPAPSSGVSQTTSAGTSAPSNSEDDISRTLGETLNRLSQNAQDLQQENSMPDDFMRAFEGMNMGGIGGMGGDGGDAGMLPMMQNIMQNLLCKEVLYPSLKEVVGKYPKWLTDNKEDLTQSDYDRYSKQLDIMQRLCGEYEEETDSDSQDVKQQRTMKVMDLIQQMEVLGQPPKEIVGDMGLDAEGNPSIPGMIPGMMPGMPGMPGMPNPEQCSIM